MDMSIALQLYTVRNETGKDFLGTLEKVAQIGYKGVEFAGFGGISAADMKARLQELGLEAVSSHVSFNDLKDKLDELISYHNELGIKYMICASARAETRGQYLEQAEFFNKVGRKCAENGITCGYHNHAHELKITDGEHGLDILLQNTSPEFFVAQFDACWVYTGGADPAEFITKYRGRCPLIHIKDIDSKKEQTMEVGEGVVDIRSTIKAAKEAGTRWLIVEQDSCLRPCLESVKISYDNTVKILNEL